MKFSIPFFPHVFALVGLAVITLIPSIGHFAATTERVSDSENRYLATFPNTADSLTDFTDELEAYVNDVEDAIRSSIKEEEFVEKEGFWYAYARRNEDVNHFNSRSTYGIGEVISDDGTTIQVQGYNSSLTTGDVLVNGLDLSSLGVINSHSFSDGVTTITLILSGGLIPSGTFILGRKNPRIEGGNLRGYTMRYDLEIDKPTKVELFAVNSEIIKSYT